MSISETRHNTWTVKTVSPDGDATSKEYNDVIIAAPFHGSGITLSSAPSWSLTYSSDSDRILPIPPQPYVHLHVTLLTTPAQHPLPEYFGLAPGSVVPQAVLTTYENARAGGKGPEFNSLTYHGKVSPNRDEHVVKIFSKEEIDDEWLKIVFGEVGWVYRKVVCCDKKNCVDVSSWYIDMTRFHSGMLTLSLRLPPPSHRSISLRVSTTLTRSNRTF